jgi:hypothetical protein
LFLLFPPLLEWYDLLCLPGFSLAND